MVSACVTVYVCQITIHYSVKDLYLASLYLTSTIIKGHQIKADFLSITFTLSPFMNIYFPNNTVEPRYNENLGTMKITLLYQGKKTKEI